MGKLKVALFARRKASTMASKSANAGRPAGSAK
jgi:hypothetical protein